MPLEKDDFTNKNREELIRSIRARPILWDRDSRKYGNIREAKAAWIAVARELRQDVHLIKKKWKNLMDTHRREVFRARHSNLHKSLKWRFFDQMEFVADQYNFLESRKNQTRVEKSEDMLDGSFEPIELIDNFEDSKLSNEDPLRSEDEESPVPHTPDPPPTPTFDQQLKEEIKEIDMFHSLTSDRKELRSKICDKLRDIEDLTRELETSYDPMKEDEDMQFLRSLHSSFASIPYPNKLLCRTKIQELIYDFIQRGGQEF